MPKQTSESFDKICSVHGVTSHYKSSYGREICRACRNLGVCKRRKKLKLKAIAYKGGACCRCGYSEYIEALEFHHTDPTSKEYDIGTATTTKPWNEFVSELDKCILVCANCHRAVHAELLGNPKLSLLLLPDTTFVVSVAEIKPLPKLVIKRAKRTTHKSLVPSERKTRELVRIKAICETCLVPFDIRPSEKDDRQFCSYECHKISLRKVDRPSAEELKKLLWEIPTKHIGEMYSVSDKAIEKWSKAYGLTKPPRGYWAKLAAKNPAPVSAKPIIDPPTKPTLSELQLLLLSNPLYSISAKYEVSDSVVDKWIKEFGLTKPPRNAWKKFTKQPE